MLQLFFSLFFISTLFGEEKFSTHSIQIEQATIAYTVTVESGEISAISYLKEGPNRPITFAFNGGPGSSSVWLHMGVFGPRRIVAPEEGQSALPPYQIIDNLETILDLTDLVFIDPMGTGFSKGKTEEEEKKCYSIKGDIQSVGTFIRDYLTKNQRWNSPKYIAGESYGAIRTAGLAEHLQNQHGINFNGLIFISPALDYQTVIFDADNQIPYFLYLPTYATTAWYHGLTRPEATLEQIAQEARDYVYEIYASSLICTKCYDPEPIYHALSKITALPLDFVQRCRGRITDDAFLTELMARERKTVGRFDTRFIGYTNSPNQDPSSDDLEGIFSGAFHDYLHRELNFPSSYTLLSMDVNSQWNYWDYNQWGYPNLMSGLRKSLAANPKMKIFVGCGYYDLATPFMATEYCLDHLDVPNVQVQLEYYDGGHMYYLNPSARMKFKQDLIRFYKENP